MPFELKGKAQILDLKLARGASDDSKVTLKIKLQVPDVPVSSLAGPFGVEDPKELEHALFKDASVDADRNSRFLGLKVIRSKEKYKERHRLTIARQRKLRCSVGTIEATPRAFGQRDVSCVVTISQPPQGYIDRLAENMHAQVDIDLEHDAELPLAGGGRADKPGPVQGTLATEPTPITKGKRGPKPGGKNKPAKAAKATKRASKKPAKKAA